MTTNLLGPMVWGRPSDIPVERLVASAFNTAMENGMGVAMARGHMTVDDDVYRIVVRIGLDSLPSMRARLLKQLWIMRGRFEVTQDIADPCGFDTDTCRTWLGDLRLLGIADREGQRLFTWRLRESFQEDEDIEAARMWTNTEDVDTPPPNSAPLIDVDSKSCDGCRVGGGTIETLHRDGSPGLSERSTKTIEES